MTQYSVCPPQDCKDSPGPISEVIRKCPHHPLVLRVPCGIRCGSRMFIKKHTADPPLAEQMPYGLLWWPGICTPILQRRKPNRREGRRARASQGSRVPVPRSAGGTSSLDCAQERRVLALALVAMAFSWPPALTPRGGP